MTITDEVSESIDREIASHPPERGGLLFGPVGRDFVTLFVPDRTAATTSATYEISAEMCVRAPEIERETNLEYKGVVHSHPGCFDSPSGGDRHSASNALRANPHLPKFFMPIITGQISDPALAHESALPHGKLSGYCAYRSRKSLTLSKATIKAENVRIVPLKGHLRELCERLARLGLPATMTEAAMPIFQENIFQLAYVIQLDRADLILFAGEDYPHFSPNLLFTAKDEAATALPLAWDVSQAPGVRLLNAVLELPQIKNQPTATESTIPCQMNQNPSI